MIRKMRIGVDISRSIEASTGVGRYARNLVHGLARIDSENDYLLYGLFCECFPVNWKQADTPKARNFSLHQKHYPSRYVFRKWRDFGKHKEKLLGGVDVVHSTAYTTPLISGPKIIVTVHDLSFFVFPQYHSDENYQFVTRHVHHAARRADFIIADSENTKREIRRFLHVPEERIEVIHLAAGQEFMRKSSRDSISLVKARYNIHKPYFLSVGSVEPRKNLARSLVAFKALIESGRVDYQFVIIGGSGWKNEGINALIQELAADGHVVYPGYLPDEDLPALYQGADVFVYPSIYEGFGLPVLEAMASGVPTITSNTTSLPEVAGDAALLINPLEPFEIFQGMEALATDPSLREELKRRGLEQSRKFSWEETARKTLKVYEKAYNQSATKGSVE
jgi:glycosyltransferase involved in cell wall biosynthesis